MPKEVDLRFYDMSLHMSLRQLEGPRRTFQESNHELNLPPLSKLGPFVEPSLATRVRRGLNRPVTRREALVSTLLAGGVIGAFKANQDYKDSDEAVRKENEYSPQFVETLTFMFERNIQLPQDKLYGFDFPTTREMAIKYLDALQPYFEPGNEETSPKLFVVQESEPLQITRKLRQAALYSQTFPKWISDSLIYMLGYEPIVHRGAYGVTLVGATPEDSSTVSFASGFGQRSLGDRTQTVYHEGVHLFFQPGDERFDDQFQAEIHANTANMLLSRELRKLGILQPDF